MPIGCCSASARARVEHAAAAWERMGRPRDLLWRRRQLAEVKDLERDSMAPREVAFLTAARGAIRRRRRLGAAGAAMLMIGAVAAGLAVRAKARRELESVVAKQLREATISCEAAREIAKQRDAARSRAFALFDAQHWDEGEEVWA